MKIVIIIQARMTSTRLPGKVLKTVLGKPLLEYQIERLRRIKSADEIVIATTTNDTDQPIVDFCNRLELSHFRGSEEDVLARYHGAAEKYNVDVVVRITSDCPLIDPTVCEKAINYFIENQDKYDYVRLEQYPRGLDAEVFSFKVLDECFRDATDKPDREHVTPFIYRNPERYRVKCINCEKDYSHHRWTVDAPEDFELVRRIIEGLYPVKKMFDFVDVLDVFEKNPDWYYINEKVRQKKYGE
ncbi:cytidylyltransferase domain-containing protein [Pelosinus propionicus]|uniref:Spore coat polysaccharide biosynthesis protein SpsF n=1 Tax=Pelosinus propionicus DSM 13327 TaxID=1123291 RepID=A0A1I4HTY4_9FIRM|nr:glycosyltransferase family protein [Pelosinus propionicus]SFL45207.1 spore coat polysaccharide biosynthesis protein SpsF [Pelosinus propionicus DSM 13327]